MSCWLGAEFLVVFFPVFLSTGVLITYVISVADGNVYPYFPYISDTGDDVPERGIFSLITTTSSFLIMIVVTIRFLHYHQNFRGLMPTCSNRLNLSSFVLGMSASIGFMIVGCFQSNAETVVHTFGAVVVFLGGILYMFTQTALSYCLVSAGLTEYIGRWMLRLRLSFCILIIVAVILTLLGSILDMSGWVHCTEHVGYVISAVGEWAAGLLIALFVLLFHPDFMRLKVSIMVTPRQLSVKDRLTESSPLMQ